MKKIKLAVMVMAGMAVSGCASVDIPTRNAPFEQSAAQPVLAKMQVVGAQVRVPRTLKVSEANTYYPVADIVWRGDALGDRHAQVKSIFESSLQAAKLKTETGVPVLLDIEVTRFHSLTEKTRYSIGGSHSIRFTLRFLNPETRQPVAEPRKIDASFKGFGGARAIAAERNGITQKKRIISQLVQVLRTEMGLTPVPAAKPEPAPAVIPMSRNQGTPLSAFADPVVKPMPRGGALKRAKPLKADRTNGLF